MRVRWTTPALRDLEAIGEPDTRYSMAAADKTVSRILQCADKLAEHPQMGRAGRVPGTRELVVSDTPYIIPYRVRDSVVEILAVFHGARRWPDKFG